MPHLCDEGGPVEVLDNERTVEKLFVVVGPIKNAVAMKMKTFLIQFGVSSDSLISLLMKL